MTQTIGHFLLGKIVVVFCHQISGPKLMVQHVVYTWCIMIYTNWFHGDRFWYVPRFQLSSQMVEPWNRALTGPRSVVWRLPSRRSSSARWCSCRWPGAKNPALRGRSCPILVGWPSQLFCPWNVKKSSFFSCLNALVVFVGYQPPLFAGEYQLQLIPTCYVCIYRQFFGNTPHFVSCTNDYLLLSSFSQEPVVSGNFGLGHRCGGTPSSGDGRNG